MKQKIWYHVSFCYNRNLYMFNNWFWYKRVSRLFCWRFVYFIYICLIFRAAAEAMNISRAALYRKYLDIGLSKSMDDFLIYMINFDIIG